MLDKLIRVKLEFLIDLGEVTGDSKELIEQEVNNMLYKLERKWQPKSILITILECKEL